MGKFLTSKKAAGARRRPFQSLPERGLANVVDNGVVEAVEQHQRNNWQGAILCDFSSLVKRNLDGHHAAQVDPLGKTERAAFGAEAG